MNCDNWIRHNSFVRFDTKRNNTARSSSDFEFCLICRLKVTFHATFWTKFICDRQASSMAANKLRLHSLASSLHFTDDGELPSILVCCFDGGSIKGIAKIGVHCIYTSGGGERMERVRLVQQRHDEMNAHHFRAIYSVHLRMCRYILIFWLIRTLRAFTASMCICARLQRPMTSQSNWRVDGKIHSNIVRESHTLERGKERRKAKHSLHNGSWQWMSANIIIMDDTTHSVSLHTHSSQLDRQT